MLQDHPLPRPPMLRPRRHPAAVSSPSSRTGITSSSDSSACIAAPAIYQARATATGMQDHPPKMAHCGPMATDALDRSYALDDPRLPSSFPSSAQDHLIPSLHLPAPIKLQLCPTAARPIHPISSGSGTSVSGARTIRTLAADQGVTDVSAPFKRSISINIGTSTSVNSSLTPSAAPAGRDRRISLAVSPLASLTLRPPLPPHLALLRPLPDRYALEGGGAVPVSRNSSASSSLGTVVPARRISVAVSPGASLTLRPPLPPHLALIQHGHEYGVDQAGGRAAASVPASANSSLNTVWPGGRRPVPLAVIPQPDYAGVEGGGREGGVIDHIQLSIDGVGSVEYPFLLRRRSSAVVPGQEATAVPHTATATASANAHAATGGAVTWRYAEAGDTQNERRDEGNLQKMSIAPRDVELEVQMVDELDVELCVLCHREKSRDEVVLREFELSWELGEASGARDDAEAGISRESGLVRQGENCTQSPFSTPKTSGKGHTGLWLVCRDEEQCRRDAVAPACV